MTLFVSHSSNVQNLNNPIAAHKIITTQPLSSNREKKQQEAERK